MIARSNGHRVLLAFLLAFTAVLFQPEGCFAAEAEKWPQPLEELERRSGARIGVAALGTTSGQRLYYRAAERFPFCSTFKVLLVGAVLRMNMEEALLDKRIAVTKDDLISWSPVTRKQAGKEMRIEDLCAATIQYSDNTAANLLLRLVGGPEGLNRFVEYAGDSVFRLDRWETELNEAAPGDPRDTTAPSAMARTLERLVFGSVLDKAGQDRLTAWLKGNTTGNDGIRAGLPEGWVAGDKTGSGAYGTTNHIAVLWPPEGSPITLAIYITQKEKDAPVRKELLAEVTRLVIHAFLANSNE